MCPTHSWCPFLLFCLLCWRHALPASWAVRSRSCDLWFIAVSSHTLVRLGVHCCAFLHARRVALQIRNHIKSSLRDVGKGWFNLKESNRELYDFSKLKRLLTMVNFMMQDTMRFAVMDNLHRFADYLVTAAEGVVRAAHHGSPARVAQAPVHPTPCYPTTHSVFSHFSLSCSTMRCGDDSQYSFLGCDACVRMHSEGYGFHGFVDLFIASPKHATTIITYRVRTSKRNTAPLLPISLFESFVLNLAPAALT